MLEILINIARGNPRQMPMPDGQVSEWQIPTIEASRQAAKDVFELINGKAVAATEVMKAIKDCHQALHDMGVPRISSTIRSFKMFLCNMLITGQHSHTRKGLRFRACQRRS